MDVTAVIKAPFEDQEWPKKLLLMGIVNVLICFTIIGMFVGIPNLMGWGKEYAKNRIAGRPDLPEFGFGYIGAGYGVILAMLPLIFPMIIAGGIASLGAAALVDEHGPGTLFGLVLLLLGVAGYLLTALIGLPLYYRHIVHDDGLAGVRIGYGLAFLKNHMSVTLMAIVISLVIGVVTMVLNMVPIIGAMFGVAFQTAALGALIAEMARVTNRA